MWSFVIYELAFFLLHLKKSCIRVFMRKERQKRNAKMESFEYVKRSEIHKWFHNCSWTFLINKQVISYFPTEEVHHIHQKKFHWCGLRMFMHPVCDYFLYLETYVIVLKVIFTLFVHNRYKETGNVFRPRTCFTAVYVPSMLKNNSYRKD